LVAHFLPGDQVFFEEWNRLHEVSRRSVSRAAAFATAAGVRLNEIPSIVVVGSKGKATAATYASAALAGTGLRVGTITSPPILTNRERIRIDGAAISEDDYECLAARAAAALRRLRPPTAAEGYLSPAGMFLIAGLDYLCRADCDVVVAEAGMGGRSDEVSLLSPAVIAVTPIFAEHVPILGRTVEEIANEKLSIARVGTKVVSAPQSEPVRRVIASLGIEVVYANLNPAAVLRLGEASAAVGIAAARGYDRRAAQVVGPVNLPGRLTETRDDRGRSWLVDAPVDSVGVAAAVQYARRDQEDVDRVVVSMPNEKDVRRTAAWLDANVGARRWRPVIPPHAAHLHYSPEPWGRPLITWPEVDPFVGDAVKIVAIGSWSFLSAVLDRLGIECDRAF
jgi:dihydrofolate synthase / folylpolyglutamate synthase